MVPPSIFTCIHRFPPFFLRIYQDDETQTAEFVPLNANQDCLQWHHLSGDTDVDQHDHKETELHDAYMVVTKDLTATAFHPALSDVQFHMMIKVDMNLIQKVKEHASQPQDDSPGSDAGNINEKSDTTEFALEFSKAGTAHGHGERTDYCMFKFNVVEDPNASDLPPSGPDHRRVLSEAEMEQANKMLDEIQRKNMEEHIRSQHEF